MVFTGGLSAYAQFKSDSKIERPKISGEVISRLRDENFGSVLSSALWVDEFRRPIRQLSVCWENPQPKHEAERLLVRRTIADTWQRYSGLTFENWDACGQQAANIRIRIADENPHTKGLGNELNNIPAGMVLNFDFVRWGADCRSDGTMFKLCTRAIAVHEFGHAIGFAHEHNRDDRAISCKERPEKIKGDKDLTDYDPDSVMNYCNPRYSNYGKLSFLDVMSVQSVYGLPE